MIVARARFSPIVRMVIPMRAFWWAKTCSTFERTADFAALARRVRFGIGRPRGSAFAPTVCGWLPRGEGVVRVWRLVGRGHVYGVEDAAPWLRALRSEASNALRPREMPNAGDRVQIDGTRSKARRSEPGVPNAVSPSVAITSSRRRRAFSHLVAPEARFQREAPHRLDAEADPGCFVQAVLAR